MMALNKFVMVLLMEIFIILPIVLGARFFNEYDSYEQSYNNFNGEKLKYPVSTFKEVAKDSYYSRNDVKKVINPRSRVLEDKMYVKSGSNFVFPDEVLTVRKNVASSRIGNGPVTGCSNTKLTVCEDVPDYPVEFVDRMLAQNSSLFHYANEDVIAIGPRVDIGENTLCPSQERVIRPRKGLNLKNEWQFIVQSKNMNFHQGIRIETCLKEDTKCELVDNSAEGYVTTCRQKYIFRELVITKDGKAIRDYIRFPASCCCHIEFVGDKNENKN